MGLASRRLSDAFGLSESLCASKHIVAGVCTSKLGIGTDPAFLVVLSCDNVRTLYGSGLLLVP